jgi:hypothetical protein
MVSEMSSTETTSGADVDRLFEEEERTAPRCLGNEPRNGQMCENAVTSLDDDSESMLVPLVKQNKSCGVVTVYCCVCFWLIHTLLLLLAMEDKKP